jgi:hypothetical protein
MSKAPVVAEASGAAKGGKKGGKELRDGDGKSKLCWLAGILLGRWSSIEGMHV